MSAMQAAITNKTINLSPVLPLLPGFLDHDARYRNQLHEFNQKSLLSQPLRLRRLDFTRLSAMDKQSELRFFGKQCQPLKADVNHSAKAGRPGDLFHFRTSKKLGVLFKMRWIPELNFSIRRRD